MTHKHSWVVIAMIIALCVGMTPGVSAVTIGPFPASGASSISLSDLLFPPGPPAAGEWTPNPAISGELAAQDGFVVEATVHDTLLIGSATQILAIQFMPFLLGGPTNPIALAIPATSTIDGITITIREEASGGGNTDTNVDLIFGPDAGDVTFLNEPINIDPVGDPGAFDASSPLNSIVDYSTSGLAIRTYGGASDDLSSPEDLINLDNTPAGGMVEAVRSGFLGWVITVGSAVAGDTISIDFAAITIDFTPGPPTVDTFTSNGDGTFDLEFSAAVTGVADLDIGDFSVVTTFGDATATVTGVTGSGSSYVVTVGSLSGDGWIEVVFIASGSGVKDSIYGITITADKNSTGLLEGVNPLTSLTVPFFESK